MNRRLRSFLRRRGATPAEIERAEREKRLTLLTFDRMLMPGPARYTFAEVCRRASFDERIAKRLWRALGFPDPPEHERLFRDEDVEAIITLRRLIESATVPRGEDYAELVQNVRVIGGALARIAEVQSDSLVEMTRSELATGRTDEEIATRLPDRFDWDRLSRVLDYALRLQLRAAARRKLTIADPDTLGTEILAVGFVDLVGYTALSQELEPDELATLVSRFEELAYDTVAEHAGRVVKTIGDEVLFVAPVAADAARIALRLTQRFEDDQLPDARAGVSAGSVVAQEGDYYGPVVNLASRLVELARPGSVLASSDFHDALGDDPAVPWQRRRSRRVRDIGRVEVWLLERAEQTVAET